MKMTCFASSSSGNCYLITSKNGTRILIEAGLSYHAIRQKLLEKGLTLNDIHAGIISHTHNDHFKGAKDLAKHIPLFVSKQAQNTLKSGIAQEIIEFEPFTINNDIKITAFSVVHDVETFGFILEGINDDEKLLYVNDAKFVEWDLSSYKFTKVMIECNYSTESIDTASERYIRTLNNHMALSTTITTLNSLDLSKCRTIYLMHLSDKNSNAPLMKESVELATKITTRICAKNGGFERI